MDNLIDFNSFSVNEGKIKDVENFGNFIKYHQEMYGGFNIPKRYIGKGKHKYRVLAREGDKVKPINFGDRMAKPKPLSRLSKKYWEALPTYR